MPAEKKSRRKRPQRPTTKIRTRRAPGRIRVRSEERATARRASDRIRVHVEERAARHHARRLLNSATDELVRVAVKASLSGIAAIAVYLWNHH
ncbi:hypothetical protein [Streptomyces chilikensis]|uniref:Uncharacterized protein n=1 Tax=Streptomyces chilikensis TaxID=1194079 RepID=A0ABV3EJ89_9ACTN